LTQYRTSCVQGLGQEQRLSSPQYHLLLRHHPNKDPHFSRLQALAWEWLASQQQLALQTQLFDQPMMLVQRLKLGRLQRWAVRCKQRTPHMLLQFTKQPPPVVLPPTMQPLPSRHNFDSSTCNTQPHNSWGSPEEFNVHLLQVRQEPRSWQLQRRPHPLGTLRCLAPLATQLRLTLRARLPVLTLGSSECLGKQWGL